MAIFVAKNGQLQTLKGMYECKEKLVEGVDYEMFTYLKGTGGCYIDTLINPAWNDQLSATTEVDGRPTIENPFLLTAWGTNTKIGFIIGGNWYKVNDPQILALQRVSDADDYCLYDKFPATAEIYVFLKVTNNAAPTMYCKINGAMWAKSRTVGTNIITKLPNTTYNIGRNNNNGLDVIKLKNVKINSHNFMPCKLNCSIPATLDNNGKARTAGECGMIDAVSGKFFGNVASTGSFTVSND